MQCELRPEYWQNERYRTSTLAWLVNKPARTYFLDRRARVHILFRDTRFVSLMLGARSFLYRVWLVAPDAITLVWSHQHVAVPLIEAAAATVAAYQYYRSNGSRRLAIVRRRRSTDQAVLLHTGMSVCMQGAPKGPITIAIRARFEYDSSAIRERYEHDTLQHATRFFVRSHTRSIRALHENQW